MIDIKDIKSVDGWRHANNESLNHISVQMYISRICNHSCPYCTHKDNSEQYKTYDEYINMMDVIYEAVGHKDMVDFSFFGGEPTIVPNFLEIIEYILTNFENSYITLTSNGSQPMEWWQQLEKWKGRIHCFMSYQHNAITDLDEYIRKMRWLYDNDFLYFLAVMLENEKEDEVKEAIKVFLLDDKLQRKLTYASIDFDFNENYSDIRELFGHLDYTVFDDQEYALKVELTNGETHYFNDHMLFKTLNLHHFKYFRCDVGKDHILLDSNGDIYVCLSHILSDQPPVGNIYTNNTLKELADSNGTICTFDECVSELWIKKERLMRI